MTEVTLEELAKRVSTVALEVLANEDGFGEVKALLELAAIGNAAAKNVLDKVRQAVISSVSVTSEGSIVVRDLRTHRPA